MFKHRFYTAATAAIVLIAVPAMAHPKLVASIPAAAATVTAPSTITLSFSERVVPRFTGASVTMISASGVAKPIVGVSPVFGGDGKTLALKPARVLGPGAYKVDWHAVAADTHHVKGIFSFTVR